MTLILISIIVQLFSAENLKDLSNAKTNKKVKETFNIASILHISNGNAPEKPLNSFPNVKENEEGDSSQN